MATPEAHTAAHAEDYETDPVESVVHVAPFVLPAVGGLLMFLLAFIAVYMA